MGDTGSPQTASAGGRELRFPIPSSDLPGPIDITPSHAGEKTDRAAVLEEPRG